MKHVELRLVSELIKNSRRSDRELARAIGVSQPTVSRLIKKLEKERYIKEYTMIPDFVKLGYELLALTFVKLRKGLSREEIEKAREISRDRVKTACVGFILVERGIGLEYDGVVISYHKSYASYLKLLAGLKKFTFLEISKIQSFLISLTDEVQYVPLTFAAISKHLLTPKAKEKKE